MDHDNIHCLVVVVPFHLSEDRVVLPVVTAAAYPSCHHCDHQHRCRSRPVVSRIRLERAVAGTVVVAAVANVGRVDIHHDWAVAGWTRLGF